MSYSKQNIYLVACSGILLSVVVFLLIFLKLISGLNLFILVTVLPLLSSLLVTIIIYQTQIKPIMFGLDKIVTVLNYSIKQDSSVTKIAENYQAIARANDLQGLLVNISAKLTELSELRRREKLLISNAADVICLLDLDAKFKHVSRACQKIWGYEPVELLDKSLLSFIDESARDNTLKGIMGSEKSIEHIVFENKLKTKQGKFIDLLWSAHWSVTDGGLFCVAHDISDRKLAENIIQENEKKIRNILTNLPAGVIVFSMASGELIFMNQTALVKTGILENEFSSGLRVCEIVPYFENKFFDLENDLNELDKFNELFESQIVSRSEGVFPAELSFCKFYFGNKKCILLMFIDCSKKFEAEKLRREFMAMISHDLRTPINGLSNALDFFAEGLAGKLNEKGRELSIKAASECRRLNRLIQDLLDLEKMRSGKYTLQFSKCNLKDLLREAVNSIEHLADARNVVVSWSLTEDIICFCDGVRIVQVLINLIENAVKFSNPESLVKIDCKITVDDTSSNSSDKSVSISIKNRGRIITSENLENIFSKFVQAQIDDQAQGSGLGLAIAKTIIEQHCGNISIESNEKEGTSVTFSLPLSKKES